MPPLIIVGGDRIELDAVVEERRDLESDVTAHPVARGVDVVDHQRPRPLRLSLRAVVSETPRFAPAFGADGARVDAGAPVLAFDRDFDRPSAVVARLRRAQEDAETCVYVGRLGRLEDLLVQAVRAPLTQMRAIDLQIELVQLRIAESRVVAVPVPRTPRAGVRRSRGKQPSREAPSSFLANLLGV